MAGFRGLEVYAGRAQQGLSSSGDSPTLSPFSMLGSPGGVRPSTVRDIVQGCYWPWGEVAEGSAGASVTSGDPEAHGGPAGVGHPGARAGGPLGPRSYYPADRGPEHPLPSGANPALFREEFPRAVRDLSPLVSARGAQNLGSLSARVGTRRRDTVLRTWRLYRRSTRSWQWIVPGSHVVLKR